MGVIMIYKAIPEQTSLFRRLRSDQKISTLFTRLFRNGPFHTDGLEPDELQDLLDWIAKDKAFGSRAELDATVLELEKELEKTKAAHPGVEDRTALLEKSVFILEERLLETVKQQGHSEAEDLVETLLFGREQVAPDFFEPVDEQLFLVPSATVQAGIEVLRNIKPEELIKGEGNPAGYHRSDFARWRRFYESVAAHDEAVLVSA